QIAAIHAGDGAGQKRTAARGTVGRRRGSGGRGGGLLHRRRRNGRETDGWRWRGAGGRADRNGLRGGNGKRLLTRRTTELSADGVVGDLHRRGAVGTANHLRHGRSRLVMGQVARPSPLSPV